MGFGFGPSLYTTFGKEGEEGGNGRSREGWMHAQGHSTTRAGAWQAQHGESAGGPAKAEAGRSGKQ